MLTGTFERSLVLFKGFLLRFQKSLFCLSAWRSSIIPHPRLIVNTFFPSFLPFFDFLFSQPFSSLSQRLQTVRQSFAASAKAGAAGKVPPALLRSVLRFIMYLYSLQSSGIRYRYSRILHHGIPFPVSSSLCPDFILKNAAQFWLKFRNAKCSGILLDLPLDSDRIELHSVRLDIVCANGYLLFQEMPVHTVSMEESYEDHQTQRRRGPL